MRKTKMSGEEIFKQQNFFCWVMEVRIIGLSNLRAEIFFNGVIFPELSSGRINKYFLIGAENL